MRDVAPYRLGALIDGEHGTTRRLDVHRQEPCFDAPVGVPQQARDQRVDGFRMERRQVYAGSGSKPKSRLRRSTQAARAG